MMIAVSLLFTKRTSSRPFSLTLSLAELSGDMRIDLSTPLLDSLGTHGNVSLFGYI